MQTENEITIVIVDDQESKRTQLRESLDQVDGFRITGEAGDGMTAVNKAVDLRPQVVLVDAALVEKDDGIEVTRRIRNELPDAAIMMMASQGYGIDIMAAIGAGANACCVKNASDDTLEMAVRTVASGGAWLDQTIASRVLRAAAASAQHTVQESRASELRSKLSQREAEVLCLIVDGHNNHDISNILSISIETVKTHIRHITDKLGVHSRTEAAVLAIHEHLTADMNFGHQDNRHVCA